MIVPLYLAAALAVLPQPAARAAFAIEHEPVGCVSAGKHPRLAASAPAGIEVASARVFFQGASRDWYSVAMKAEGAAFVGILPAPKSNLREFRYYIEVVSRTLETARTADLTARVASSPGQCGGAIAAAGASSILVQGPAGAAAVPPGFAPAGLVAAGGGISATTVAVVGAAVGGGALAAARLTGGADYVGQVSGTYTLSFGGCQRAHRFTGTLAITLSGDGGEASSDGGRYETLSSDCPSGPQTGSVLNAGFPVGRITRSGDAISYSASEVNGANTSEASFTGTLSGNTITGTFTYSEKIGAATGRYTTGVTLTKR